MPEKQNELKKLLPRPPIVVVMGHIDHGKSSLLDFIRKTNVAAKEAGGITQSIGAYEVIRIHTHNSGGTLKEEKITFIDTPGHEAFSKMRERGAHVADLAILVVAADDGVKPQTKEVIGILNNSKTPYVVAINKIDKFNADIERTKNDLMANGVLLEGYGGNISWQAISAKTGQGIDELLDLILLSAEMEELTYDPQAEASGVIIESKMDSRRGVVATAIVKNGILKTGDEIATNSVKGRIKILENFLGEKTQQLAPSSPALILGFEDLPKTGEEFVAGPQIDANMPQISQMPGANLAPIREINGQISDDLRVVNLIVKADVLGSLEVFSETIKKLPQNNVKIKIIGESIGEISDGDIKTAAITNSLIIGFNVELNKAAESFAKAQGVKIITSKIIYELIQALEEEMKNKEKPKPLAEVEILAVFSRKGNIQLIGGKVVSGAIKNKSRPKIARKGEEIGSGKINNLQCQKKDASEVSNSAECGILFESEIVVEVGDYLVL